MIIAIDGPSGTGKSTVAKEVAKRLGFVYFDTGAMYRCFAWKVLQENVSTSDEKALRPLIDHFCFDIQTDELGEKHYLVDHIDVSARIRTQEISNLASQISVYPFVRQTMVRIQREYGKKGNIVFEGRDMGTVVFPDARLKIFLTARPEVRADRRYRELLVKFPDLTASSSMDQILKEIEERDRKDTTRSHSPLRQAKDAIAIDTSDLAIEEAVDRVVNLWTQRKEQSETGVRFWGTYGIVYYSVRGIFKLFYRLKVYGEKHVRPGAAVIAANHSSFFDPPIVSVSCPEEVHFLAREPLFRVPVLGTIIRKLHSHPISRNASDVQTFRVIIQLLRDGDKVLLFPEGSRSLDGQIQPLEKGLSFLVYKVRCQIIPVYVDGAYRAWRRGVLFPKPWGRIRCVFGSPIDWTEFEGLEKKEAMDRITERTDQAIRALKQWLEDGAKGSPP